MTRLTGKLVPKDNGYVKIPATFYTNDLSGGGGTSDYSELENKPTINGVELNGDLTNADLYIGSVEIEYQDLVTLRDNGEMVPGTQYRITNYQCTTTQANTQSAGHVFDIIVRADSENTLNENAFAAHHKPEVFAITFDNDVTINCYLYNRPNTSYINMVECATLRGIEIMDDEITIDYQNKTASTIYSYEGGEVFFMDLQYEYFQYCKLEAWELKYCLDNDTNRFVWADEENGKGVIFYMKDEWNNECPYDFKNIMFKRKLTDGALDDQGIDTWCYTFNGYNSTESEYYDMSSHMFYISEQTRQDAIDDGDGTDECDMCYNNVILPAKSIGDFGYYNIEVALNDIVFLGESYDDGYDNGYAVSFCYGNSFGNGCYGNTFIGNCYKNTFGMNCNSNTFGNNCNYNTFGNYCQNNLFGNYCSYNTFRNNCQNNLFGNNCQNNLFGNGCYSNTFGNYCNRNTFGNYFYQNTVGNDFQNNSFGNECSNNSFGNNCQSITVFDGVQNCSVTGGSQNAPVKNAQILNGTAGASQANKLTITFAANKSYTQIAAKNSSGILNVWVPADLT